LTGTCDSDGFLVVYLEKIDVKDVVFDRMELDIFEDSHAFVTVDVEFDGVDVGSVDEFAHSFVCHCEVGCDETFAVADFYDFFAVFECAFVGELDYFATVEHYGNFTFCAEGFGCFFAELYAGSG